MTKAEFTILECVSQEFQVPHDLITSHCRKMEVKYARWMYWHIMYQLNYTLVACASLTGHNYTSVLCALAKIDRDMRQNKELMAHHNNLKHLYVRNSQPHIAQEKENASTFAVPVMQ